MQKLTDKQKEFRKETSRLISIANKRLERLGNSEWKSSPAYKKWVEEGSNKFGIRGKTQQEARNEYFRVKNFLDSETSSITGTKRVLKNTAENVGLKYNSMKELQDNATPFFELANKVDEYLKVSNRGSEAIGYQRIWQAINQYIQDENVELSKTNINGLITHVADLSEQKLLQSNRNSYTNLLDSDWTQI